MTNLTGQERYSIPFFFGVDYDTIISVLPNHISEERPACKLPFKAGEVSDIISSCRVITWTNEDKVGSRKAIKSIRGLWGVTDYTGDTIEEHFDWPCICQNSTMVLCKPVAIISLCRRLINWSPTIHAGIHLNSKCWSFCLAHGFQCISNTYLPGNYRDVVLGRLQPWQFPPLALTSCILCILYQEEGYARSTELDTAQCLVLVIAYRKTCEEGWILLLAVYHKGEFLPFRVRERASWASQLIVESMEG